MSLPHDEIRERRVLALLVLRGSEALLRLPAAVTDEVLYLRHHQAIYRAVRGLDASGKRWIWADVVTWLEANEPAACKLIGGASKVITELLREPDAWLEAMGDDVGHLLNHHRLRQTLLALDRAREAALRPCADGEAVTAQALQALGTVAEVGHQDETTPGKRLIHERMTALEARMAAPNPQPGRLTQIARLDELTGGLHPGQLVVLAGREGDGKSALAAQIAADGLAPFLYVSLEMSRAEVQDRLLIQGSRLRADNFDAGMLTGADLARAVKAGELLYGIGYEISDRSDLTIDQIRWLARRWHHRIGRPKHALVVVDYLQLCSVPSELRGKAENREREVAHISRTLKKLALETGLIVMALSQLNDDGKLRESRAIGQDADLVLRIDEVKGEADQRDLTIAKGRRTRKGSAIRLTFKGEILRFAQLGNGVPYKAEADEPEKRRSNGRTGAAA